MMPDSAPRSDVFTSILRVLERIEEKLDGQEQGPNTFENIARGPRSAEAIDPISEVDLADLPELNGFASPENSIPDIAIGQPHEKAEVPYSDMGSTFQETDQNEELKELLVSYLGDCWKLPDDKRLPLNLVNRAVDWTHAARDPQLVTSSIRKDAIKRGLERLKGFDIDLRSQLGNDFFIIDYSPKNSSRLYRLGEKAVGSELRVSLGKPSHHQWSRLMYVMFLWPNGLALTNV
jgi:hypothetical protein